MLFLHRVFRCALTALLLSTAAPTWAARDVMPRDVMLVLDNSGSMRRNDPARLAAAAVEEFIKNQPFNTRVGVVLFADTAELIAPLTLVDDESTPVLMSSLARFDYRGKWTQIADGVERALYELRQNGRAPAPHAIVLMTDGLIDTGDARRDSDLKAWLQTSLAQQAQREPVRIFGIAFTERADYQLLQSLAAGTGGEYFRVLNARDLAPALQRIESALTAAAPGAGQEAATPAASPASPPENAPTARPVALPPTSTDGQADRSMNWLWLVLVLAAAGALVLGLRSRRKPDVGAVAAARGPAGPQAVLVDLLYPTGPRRYEVSHRPVVIGRKAGSDPNQDYVVVPEKTVGRWHATILRQGQVFSIRDEKSVNGTFINNVRITGEQTLKHNDIVRVHGHSFEFQIPDLANSESTVMLPGR